MGASVVGSVADSSSAVGTSDFGGVTGVTASRFVAATTPDPGHRRQFVS
jgi:hypothetical protein